MQLPSPFEWYFTCNVNTSIIELWDALYAWNYYHYHPYGLEMYKMLECYCIHQYISPFRDGEYLLQDLDTTHVVITRFNKLYRLLPVLSAILQVIITIVSSNWQASNNNNVYQYQYWVVLVPAHTRDRWLLVETYLISIPSIDQSIQLWIRSLISSFYEKRIFVWIESNRIESE